MRDTGKRDEALQVLKNTLARHPNNRNCITALLTFSMEIWQTADAVEIAQQLVLLELDRPEFAALAARLRRQLPEGGRRTEVSARVVMRRSDSWDHSQRCDARGKHTSTDHP